MSLKNASIWAIQSPYYEIEPAGLRFATAYTINHVTLKCNFQERGPLQQLKESHLSKRMVKFHVVLRYASDEFLSSNNHTNLHCLLHIGRTVQKHKLY
jgi:hypothetical protein